MFIMLDGIDGSGKSTVMAAWKEFLTKRGHTVFDLKAYWQKTGCYPELRELKPYDFILSCEPTFVGVGAVIRDELIKNGRDYPPRAIAESYALDRLILYKKIIIPALEKGKCVIQDRGITSSLAYQPLADKKLTPKFLASVPGNALALKYRPGHIVLLNIPAAQALERLHSRHNKRDDVIFEKTAFQTKLAKIFASRQYAKIFTKRGSLIHQLPAGVNIAILQKTANELLAKLLSRKS